MYVVKSLIIVKKRALKFKRIYIIVALLFSVFFSFSQEAEQDSLFWFRGSIVDMDNLSGLFNVHIINQTKKYGSVSRIDGDFRIAATVGDFVKFSLVGYKTLKIVVVEDYKINKNVRVDLKFSPIEMDAVVIIGKTFEQFREEFRRLKVIPISINDAVSKMFGEQLRNMGPAEGSIGGPIQFLYDKFNGIERLRRGIINNRKKYGNPDDYIEFPAYPPKNTN